MSFFSFVLILYCGSVASTASMEDVKLLMQDLFANYSKDVRPVRDQDKPVKVNVEVFPHSINDYDEVTGVLSVMLVLRIGWIDESLVWNPARYGNTSVVTFPQTKIWLPVMSLSNSAETFAPIGDSHSKVRVLADGIVSWISGGFVRAKCPPDVSKFPFDQHTCTLNLSVWSYTNRQVSISMLSNVSSTSNTFPNSEWDLIGSESVVHIVLVMFDIASFSFTIKRRSMNFLITVVMPIIMLALINPFVFILPLSSGERVGYSITVLLAFIMYMTVVNDRMPPSSDPMSYLLYYLMSLLGISLLIVTVNIFQIRTYGKDNTKEPVPKCVGRPILCLVKFRQRGRVLELGEQLSSPQEDKRYQMRDKSCTDNLQGVSFVSVNGSNSSNADMYSESEVVIPDVVKSEVKWITWDTFAAMLDNIYFIIFQLITIMFCLLWIIAVQK